jgi:bis(5'-nucleosidyl)-tetraphosphatase
MKHKDRWDLPKGHLDAGETTEQAAIRELAEETGITVQQIWTDPVFRYTSQYYVTYKRDAARRRLKQLTIFLGIVTGDTPILPTEHLGFEWLQWNPPHRIQTETIDPLLEQVASHMEKAGQWPLLQ